MAVAFDAFTAGPGATGAANESYTHTPVGTPRAIIVQVVGISGSDIVTSVSYGGVAMVEVTGSPNVKGAAEVGDTYTYFLGSGIPTGAQTVLNVGTATRASSCISLTAADNTEVVDTDATINSNSLANPSATLALAGRTCFCAEVFFSGQGAVTGITPLTGWTGRREVDNGASTAGWYTYNTISTPNVTMGWTQLADDAVCIGVAVSEVQAGTGWGPLLSTRRNRLIDGTVGVA